MSILFQTGVFGLLTNFILHVKYVISIIKCEYDAKARQEIVLDEIIPLFISPPVSCLLFSVIVIMYENNLIKKSK